MRPKGATVSGRVRRRIAVSPDFGRRKSSLTGDVVVSTFANVDLRFTKAAMAEYSRRCETMSRENELLRAQLEEQESDAIKVVQYFEQKLQDAEAAVTKQSGEIERLLRENAVAEDALRCQYERMLEERDKQISQYASLTQALQVELKASTAQVQDRAMHHVKLQQLQDEIEEIRMRHECELAALRFQSVDRKMRLVSLEETMRERFKSQVEKESARLLEVKSKALIEDHEALQHERVRLTKDIEDLVQLATAKNIECGDERRKGELHRRACEEALRRIVNGNRCSRELKVRTQQLEQRVKELTHEKEVMREELSNQYEARILELEKALAETRKSLHSHRAELQRLRHVASTVVNQRSDLERFFYIALNDVRRMRSGTVRCQKTQRRHVQGPLTRLPSINKSDSVTIRGPVLSSVLLNPQEQQQQQVQVQCLSSASHSLENFSPLATRSLTFLTEPGHNTNATASVLVSSPRLTAPTNLSAAVASPPPLLEYLWHCGDGGVKPTHDVTANGSNVLQVNLGKNGEGAYLDDLSWEDKEKIIKALLFFINQTCYQRLSGKPRSGDEEKLQKS